MKLGDPALALKQITGEGPCPRLPAARGDTLPILNSCERASTPGRTAAALSSRLGLSPPTLTPRGYLNATSLSISLDSLLGLVVCYLVETSFLE